MSQQQNCKSTIERAFEIAASGEAMTIERLGRVLAGEGYSINMLTGPLLIKQLRQQMGAGERARVVT
jgi:hypothetical protein